MAELNVHSHAAVHGGLPILGAMAWPEGEVRLPAWQSPGTVTLQGPDATTCLADAAAMETWPDGSTRWGLLAFRATAVGRYTWDGQHASADAPQQRSNHTVRWKIST